MIVTDLDGTLLNDQKELPEGFEELEKELRNRGIVLVVASGRPYISMSRILNKYTNHLLFIAENGGLIKYREKVLKSSPMTAEHVHELILIARRLDQCHILLCGENKMWYESNNETFIKESRKYYDHMIHVADLTQVTEPVIKFTICDLDNAENNSQKRLEYLKERFSMAVSGERWLDITSLHVNKGEAVKYVLNFLGITAENTMAFGDYFNDREMLQLAGKSILMKNAHPGMKSYAKYVSPYSNNEGSFVFHVNEILKTDASSELK